MRNPICILTLGVLAACAAEDGTETSRPISTIDVRHSEGFCQVTSVTGAVPNAEPIVALDIFPLEPEPPDLRVTNSQCHEEDGSPVACPNFDVGLVEADHELDEHYGTGELDDNAAGSITTRDFKLDGDGGLILLDTTGKLETNGSTGTFELGHRGSVVASTIYELGSCEWTKLGLNRFDEYVLAIEVAPKGGSTPAVRQNTWFHIDSSIWLKLKDFEYSCRVTVGGTTYEARLALDLQFAYELRAVDAASGAVRGSRSSVIGAMVEVEDALSVSDDAFDARITATSLARWDARTPPRKRDGDLPEQFVRLDHVPDAARTVGALKCETVPRAH